MNLPYEVLRNEIFPHLTKREITALSSTCCVMASVVYKAIRIIDLNEGIFENDMMFNEKLKDALQKEQRLEIIFTDNFDRIKLLIECARERPLIYKKIRKLDFRNFTLTNRHCAEIEGVLKKTHHLQTLLFGPLDIYFTLQLPRFKNLRRLVFRDVGKRSLPILWSVVDLRRCTFQELKCLIFNGRVSGEVTFPEGLRLNKLRKLSYNQLIGRIDFNNCSLPNLALGNRFVIELNRFFSPQKHLHMEMLSLKEINLLMKQGAETALCTIYNFYENFSQKDMVRVIMVCYFVYRICIFSRNIIYANMSAKIDSDKTSVGE